MSDCILSTFVLRPEPDASIWAVHRYRTDVQLLQAEYNGAVGTHGYAKDTAPLSEG